MGELIALTGNSACAQAMRQINPDVCAAYPITPSTQIMEEFSDFVADGLVDTELVTVESEHSAMSACIGASCAGGRVMTATSACGLALMWEVLYVAASLRTTIVMPVVNRALSGNINIHGDHSDTYGARDAGWIQLYGENAQEAYDNTIMAVRISEHPDVRLPVITTLDGFFISHSVESMEMLSDEVVKEFVGTYSLEQSLLNFDSHVSFGPLDLQDYYFEHRRSQAEAMKPAAEVISQVSKEFAERFGREYSWFEAYKMDDAEVALVCMSSAAGTIKVVVDSLREQGKKVGLIKPRVFRPFPTEQLVDALKGLKAFCVMDRADSIGAQGGAMFTEIRSAMYELDRRPPMFGRIFGLGGRDLPFADVEALYDEAMRAAAGEEIKEITGFISLRD